MDVTDCVSVYGGLLRKKFIMYLDNNSVVELAFSVKNFKHLIGLHKLIDLPTVLNTDSKKIYKDIQKGKTNNLARTICSSSYYGKIEERILYFGIIPEIMKSKVIIDFDVNKVPISCDSKLQRTDYILYKRIDEVKVAHLALVKGDRNYEPQSFFVEHSNIYLTEQNYCDIVKLEIVEF